MNVGDTFTHNGVTFTVTEVPEEGTVKGVAEVNDSDAPKTEGGPMGKRLQRICIKEADIQP